MPARTRPPANLRRGTMVPWQVRGAVDLYNRELEVQGLLTRLILTGSRDDHRHQSGLYAFGALGRQEPVIPAAAELADLYTLTVKAVRAEFDAVPDHSRYLRRARSASARAALGALTERMSQGLAEHDAKPPLEVPW